MSNIKRYDYDKVWGMEKNELGDYVQYDDHAAIVAQLEADLSEARKDQARFQFFLDEWLEDTDLSFEILGSDGQGSFIQAIDAMIKDQQ